MKKSWCVLSILMVVLLLTANVFAVDEKESVVEKSKIHFIDALVQVESGGNVNAIGDGGASFGCLQIQRGVIADVNRVYKTHYSHIDAFDKRKAESICRKYLSYWGKHYEKVTNKTATLEILARIWNGGPNGYKKAQTIAYWNKVREKLYG